MAGPSTTSRPPPSPLLDMDYKYLGPSELAGFDKYKYSSIDTNPLSIYIMHPFWNKTVQLCPKWVAPNLLTFVGFLFTVGAYALLTYYDNDFLASTDDPAHPPIPDWAFIATSAFIFVAYTLDGIDGKQARRTGTSGPLGELFDHGLDSWTAVLIPTCLYSVFGRSPLSVTPIRYYWICWNVFITFYITHWEKYNTGVLFLPWGYDFSMISTTLLFFVTYFMGHEGWKVKLTETVTTGHVMEVIFYLTSICATLPIVLYNIYKSYRDGTCRHKSPIEGLRPLTPVFILLLICSLWLSISPSDIMEVAPRAFYMFTGTVFSNITCRLVVAQMSQTRCDAWNWLFWPCLGVVALVWLFPNASFEFLLLHALWAFATWAHIHYGACVVRQMCEHFRIMCFTIKDRVR